MKNPLFILTYIYVGIIESHTLTRSEDQVRDEIFEFAKKHEFKLTEGETNIFELVDEIKSNSGFSEHEIHLELIDFKE